MSIEKKRLSAALLVLLVTGAFFGTTRRRGHDWGDDFAFYVHHAANLATGVPYADTGFIDNPSNPTYSPPRYPPVFPMLLAPVYALRGLDLEAMKLLVLLFFLPAMFLAFLLFEDGLPSFYAPLALALAALHPYYWHQKDQVLSEFPFMFFAYASLYAAQKAPAFPRSPAAGRLYAAGLGVLFYLAYGTRSIGIVLVPAFLIFEFLRLRKIPARAFVTLGTFFVLYLLQNALSRGERSYFALFTLDVRKVLWLSLRYAVAFRDLWESGGRGVLANALFATTGVLAAAGFFCKLRRKATIVEIFVVLYMALVVTFTGVGERRYLIPVLPFYLAYAFYAVRESRGYAGKGFERAVLAACLTMMLLSYGASYAGADYGPLRDGVETPDAAAFYGYVRDRTRPADVFVLSKPRALSLLTGRRAAVYPLVLRDAELWRYLERVHAAYLVASPPDDPPWRGFLARSKDRLRPVYANASMTLYRLDPPPKARDGEP